MTSLMNSSGKGNGLLYSLPMCSVQKLPSTKAADFHLQNYNYYISLKRIYS